MEATLGKESGVFMSEKIKLVVIAILFIFSYLLDLVYEFVYLSH